MQNDWSKTERGLLSVKEIENAKPGRLRDGGGLYLEVDGKNKRWLLRKSVNGRPREFGLGSFPTVSAIAARQTMAQYENWIAQGKDPLRMRQEQADAEEAEAKRSAEMLTFEQAARQYYEENLPSWSNGKHKQQWISTLEQHAFPQVGAVPIDKFSRQDALAVLKPIWLRIPETADRTAGRMEAVLDWAAGHGYRDENNPVRIVKRGKALPRRPKQAAVKHHASLPHDQVPEFISRLRAGGARDATKLSFELMILTSTRSVEVREMTWREVDLGGRVWTIPAERMKMRIAHEVPLSPRAVEILEQVQRVSDGKGLVFRDPKTKAALSENTYLNCRVDLGYPQEQCTPHGFRATFRTWASLVPIQALPSGDRVRFQHEVCEACLSHVIADEVVRAYLRTTNVSFMDARRDLMAQWAAYIEPARHLSANVVPLRA